MTFYAGIPVGTFTQSSASNSWSIVHNFGMPVNVNIVNSSGEVMFPQNVILSSDMNTSTITFSSAITGTARIVGVLDRTQAG